MYRNTGCLCGEMRVYASYGKEKGNMIMQEHCDQDNRGYTSVSLKTGRSRTCHLVRLIREWTALGLRCLSGSIINFSTHTKPHPFRFTSQLTTNVTAIDYLVTTYLHFALLLSFPPDSCYQPFIIRFASGHLLYTNIWCYPFHPSCDSSAYTEWELIAESSRHKRQQSATPWDRSTLLSS